MLDLELDSMLYDIHVFWHLEYKLFLSWDDILKKLKIIAMVHSWVGKEFPDMRQKEREIKLIKVGDTVRTVGWIKWGPTLNRAL